MRMSDRLLSITEEIREGETVADIGTDHGLLPAFLLKEGISPRVILTDISPLSLEKAGKELERNGLLSGERFSLRCGHGLSVLEPDEADAVVIAGMGGMLIASLMGEDPGKSRTFGKFILQPRRHTGRLRCFLWENHWLIKKEKFAREGKFIWPVIVAKPDRDMTAPEEETPGYASEIENGMNDGIYIRGVFENFAVKTAADIPCVSREYGKDPYKTACADYPDTLTGFSEPLLSEYLNREMAIQKRIFSRIPDSSRDDREFTKARIRQIGKLLKETGCAASEKDS